MSFNDILIYYESIPTDDRRFYVALFLFVSLLTIVLVRRPLQRLNAESNSIRDYLEALRDGKDLSSLDLPKAILSTGRELFILGTIAWLIIGIAPLILGGGNLQDSAQIGDSFGAANAWFSGLALGGVVLAIVMQTVELRFQRKEMESTRVLLNDSAKAHQESQRQLTKQTEFAFLSTYIDAIGIIGTSDEEGGEDAELHAAIQERVRTVLMRLERDQLQAAISLGGDMAKIRRDSWCDQLEICIRSLEEYSKSHGEQNRNTDKSSKILVFHTDKLETLKAKLDQHCCLELIDGIQSVIDRLCSPSERDLRYLWQDTAWKLRTLHVGISEGSIELRLRANKKQ